MAKFWVILILLSLLVVGFLNKDKLLPLAFSSRNSTAFSVANKVSTAITNSISSEKPDMEVVAKDLNIPWEIAFLPDGSILATERGGKLLRIGKGTNGIVNRWIKNAFYSLYNVGAYSKNLPKNAKIKIIMQRLDTK